MDMQYMEARFKLEHAMLEGLLNGEGTLPERQARVRAQHAGNLPTPPAGPLPGMALPEAALQVVLSADMYRWIQDGHRYRIESDDIPFTDEVIEDSKAFVSELLGVDLTEVRVIRVPCDVWGDDPAEGFQIDAGAEAPVVFVPEAFYSPHELLVHELAHGAHTLVRRRDGGPAKAFASGASAEFIAHFAQYHYLVAHCGERAFAAAMGQLTTAMYAQAIYAYAREEGLSCLQGRVEDFLSSSRARPFLEALGEAVPRERFGYFAGSFANLGLEVNRALGIMLAVMFRHDAEGVKAYMAIDSLDRTIKDKVAEAFGQDLESQLQLFEGDLMAMREEFR